MSLSIRKLLVVLSLVGALMVAQEPQWKDRDEYDIAQKAQAATDLKQKIELLKQWKEKYPDSAFKQQRQETLLQTYQAAGDIANSKASAKELLTMDAKSYVANYMLARLAFSNQSPSPADLEEATNAANGLLGSLDDTFSAAKKPAGVGDDQWTQAKTESAVLAHSTLAWVSLKKSDPNGAIGHYTDALKVNVNNAAMSLQIGQLYFQQKKQALYPLGFYHYARAISITGPGELPAADKARSKAYLEKNFANWRKDPKALADLKAQAAANPFPPADFYIKSDVDLEKEAFDKEEKLRKENPALALWIGLRKATTAADGQNYWDSGVKQTLIPPDNLVEGEEAKPHYFKAKFIRLEPETKPTMMIVAIEDQDGKVADATLKFDNPITGTVEPGTIIEFRGVADTFTKEPYTMTLLVDGADVKGWPEPLTPSAKPAKAKPAKAKPAPAKRPAAAKKK